MLAGIVFNVARLGDFLKSHRLNSGFSQAEVATKLGYISPQFISNWERGVSCPPLNKLNELVDLYRISKTDLIDLILDETKTSLEIAIYENRKKRKIN